MPIEKPNKLVDLSVSFAVEILNLVKFLKSQHETIISNQIGRAGTSIGANIHEAQYAHGKADFISKLQIALKKPIKRVTGCCCFLKLITSFPLNMTVWNHYAGNYASP